MLSSFDRKFQVTIGDSADVIILAIFKRGFPTICPHSKAMIVKKGVPTPDPLPVYRFSTHLTNLTFSGNYYSSTLHI